jgi:hypothetical protein
MRTSSAPAFPGNSCLKRASAPRAASLSSSAGTARSLGEGEMRAALLFATDDKDTPRPVIPVLLPGAKRPKLPLFLQSRTWVDLPAGPADEAALDRLVWASPAGRRHDGTPTAPTRGLGTTPRTSRRHYRRHCSSKPCCPALGRCVSRPPSPSATFSSSSPSKAHSRRAAHTMGQSIIDGTWQADTAAHQITLQGRQAAGFQSCPTTRSYRSPSSTRSRSSASPPAASR